MFPSAILLDQFKTIFTKELFQLNKDNAFKSTLVKKHVRINLWISLNAHSFVIG